MKNTLKAVAAAALVVAGGVAQANTVSVIDLFTTVQTPVTDTMVDGLVVTSQVGGIADVSILGGYRDLFVDLKTANASFPSATMSVGGSLNFSNTTGAGSTGVVRWDGAKAGVTGLTFADALNTIDYTGLSGTFVGNPFTDSFEVQILESDGGFKFVIEAYNSSTQWSKVEIISNAHPVPATSYIPLLAFLDCTNAFPVPGVVVSCGAGGAADFTALGALQVVLDPSGTFTNLDLRLQQITVVPEPASIALVGLAMLGLGAVTRRRKQDKA